jgi:hypothetical protein
VATTAQVFISGEDRITAHEAHAGGWLQVTDPTNRPTVYLFVGQTGHDDADEQGVARLDELVEAAQKLRGMLLGRIARRSVVAADVVGSPKLVELAMPDDRNPETATVAE